MKTAVGILTARGGLTSHAAVVASGMGKCCVTACSSLRVDAAKKTASFIGGGKEHKLKEGDVLTLDGSTGEVFLGSAPLVPAQLGVELGTLMQWVDEFRRLEVRTNADTPTDARTARAFGAEGIGLCRTEHMFFQPERLIAVREMILAADEAGRRAPLAKILPMQRGDFAELFRVMDGLPVTIRLLDPPLHEFLPHTPHEIEEVALTPMDLESYTRWDDYTTARDAMFEATHTAWAPWHVVNSDDKERARLNLIRHLLSLVPNKEAPREEVKLPKRKVTAAPVPAERVVFVPEQY